MEHKENPKLQFNCGRCGRPCEVFLTKSSMGKETEYKCECGASIRVQVPRLPTKTEMGRFPLKGVKQKSKSSEDEDEDDE